MADIQTAGWKVCTPDTAAHFSAVAYFFGREVNQHEHVPIGLIDATWGGTPAEAWTSLDALTSDPALMPVMAAYATLMDTVTATQLKQAIEKQTNATLAAAGKPPIAYPYEPSPNIWTPAALFNAMIAPLTAMPLRGVIWYQGESNGGSPRAPMYRRLFATLIADWRRQWGDEEMPFLFVQLANYNAAGDLATVREGQRRALELRRTGMAVAIDIGERDNVHPADKQDVGHRLALIARRQVYGETLEDSGPMVSTLDVEQDTATVYFTHDDGLTARGGAPTGFEIAGDDGVFRAAEAKLDGVTVKVTNPHVPHPVSVRYGWANDPMCNLYNSAGLPASPFTVSAAGLAIER
jgi:sialate O-acetylesterase